MCTTPDFVKKYYDIAQVSNAAQITGENAGSKLWDAIEKVMNETPDETLIIIDLYKCTVLDYNFCKCAFGPLFQTLENKCFSKKYVLFQINDYHQPVFFRGVMWHFNFEFHSEVAREKFISSNKYVKLIDNAGKINFIGKLEENENIVLDVVNKMGEITVENVMEETGLPAEVIVHNLNSLVEKYFIVGPFVKKSSKPIYYSFKKYF